MLTLYQNKRKRYNQNMHQLSKTDFIQYMNCPKSLWLLKNQPESYTKAEMTLFLEKLIQEGYEVEAYAAKLFPKAEALPDFGTPEYTKEALETTNDTFLQASFLTTKGVFARVDVVQKQDDGSFHIFEIKSSTSIKTDAKHNHLKDACFQKYTLEQCGYQVSRVSMIHLNKDYVRFGDIDPEELFCIVDVTEDIEDIYPEVTQHIEDAVQYINKKEINMTGCPCKENTRSNHCDSFDFFNPDIPDYSIYEIGRISKRKVQELLDMEVMKITDIPADYTLNEKQQLQVLSAKERSAVIDHHAIKEALGGLIFPLHFLDYETYASAVPKIDGIGPHQHIPFQVSIHTLQADGSVQHFEYLAESFELPEKLIQFMQKSTGDVGTYISWHAGFEQGRNKEMIKQFPQHAPYLEYMNTHMFDLEEIFKKDYVDYRFHGSSSIKKVLPVIVPQFSYADLEIQNGTMALDAWGRMVLDPNWDGDRASMRKDLLAYCELDTLAMLEIYMKIK